MWDQDKQQMEQESSKTSFALIRLTLDYINMRNLGITVRRITPNANQFLAWIIGSSIPERKCMIGKGWVDTFIWVSTGCSIWAQNVFARSNGFQNRNFDSYLWLSPNIGNLQVGSEKRKKKWKMNHHSLLSEKKWTNVALNRKTWPISLDHVMIFFPSCDFLSKGEQIARVIRQKAKRGFIIFSYLSSTYYTHIQEKSFNVIYIFLRIADQKERLIENLKNGPKNVSLTYTSRFSKNRPLLLTLLLRMVSGQ